VRDPSHFDAIRSLGAEVVQGRFSDTNLISSRVRAADITVNLGNGDSTVLNEAILAGQKARVVDDGKTPAGLLHMSGLALFFDGGRRESITLTANFGACVSGTRNICKPYFAAMTCAFGEVHLCSS
jgi:hypothetical protein